MNKYNEVKRAVKVRNEQQQNTHNSSLAVVPHNLLEIHVLQSIEVMMSSSRKVIVTGFGSFSGVSVNPVSYCVSRSIMFLILLFN